MNTQVERPAIAWTIAGSDSGGGAGIQADLATFRDFGVHGCSVVTALTAQNSIAITDRMDVPVAHVAAQLEALADDLPAAAVKLGMLPSREIVDVVETFLTGLTDDSGFVVFDPVMRSSTGTLLLDSQRGSLDAIRRLLAQVDLVTPNIAEAEALTGLVIDSYSSLQAAAERLLALGARAVLITGGHFRIASLAQGPCIDFWLDADGARYLSGEYIDTRHTHGSGCSLASAIAALVARGFEVADALVIAKAYLTAGIRAGRALGKGPGPVAHQGWPGSLVDWPGVSRKSPRQSAPLFPRCEPLGLYPVVDDVLWIERLLPLGVTTIQLRIKQMPEVELRHQIVEAVALSRRFGVQLFINDYWQLAIECGAFGVHLGQEDLDDADLEAIANAGLRLGISTHSDYEVARAHHIRPSYIAIGPIYPTTTKVMAFSPRGLERLRRWVALLGDHYPLTAIGGIDLQRAPGVLATGVGSCAVVRAITEAEHPDRAVAALLALHQRCESGLT